MAAILTSRSVLRVLVATCLAMSASPAAAQAQDRWPISLEANIGPGGGRQDAWYVDGKYEGISAELLLALRLASTPAGGFVAGINLGVHETGEQNATCPPRELRCQPPAPEKFRVLAATLGLETANGGFRVMAGPALVKGHIDDARRDADSEGGVQGRLDWALPIVSRLSLSASLRGVLVPDYGGGSIRLWAIGGGVRLR